jgi:hypothetical protein
MCVHNILLNDLVQQLLVSEDYYAHWQAAAAAGHFQENANTTPFLKLHISAGIFACPIFCLKQSAASAHRSFSLRQRYPPPNMDKMLWGRRLCCLCRAEALYLEF